MPLTYRDRGTSGTQLDIMSGQAVVGSLWKAVFSATAGGSAFWSWTFHSGPTGPKQHGNADTLDAAKSKIEERWAAWLDAAELREK